MNKHDVLKLQVELGVNFPADYSEGLVKGIVLPDQLLGYIFSDYATIKGINNELRTGEFSREWDRRWLIIGNDASGNLFFLNTDVISSPVYLWDHETHEKLQIAESYLLFHRRLIEHRELF